MGWFCILVSRHGPVQRRPKVAILLVQPLQPDPPVSPIELDRRPLGQLEVSL
jgi:hypothetical protein